MGVNDFSYSKLDTYKQCPFKFYLNYILETYAYSSSIATEFGTAIHKCEETLANCIKNDTKIDYEQIKNEFVNKLIEIQQKYPEEYFTSDGKSSRNYQQKADEYLKIGIYRLENFMKNHPTYKIIGVEKKFNFKFDDTHSFNGAIDRVFYDTATDTYLIQDIKSWPVEAKKEDLTTPLQFVFYSLAVSNEFNCDIHKIKCQYDLPLVGTTQDAGTAGFLNRGYNKISKLFNRIEDKDYTPNATPLCNYCSFCSTNPNGIDEYMFLCPYHSMWDRVTRKKSDICKKEYEWLGIEKHQQILEEYHKKHGISVKKH